MSAENIAIVWLLTGVIGHMFWPIYYYRNMEGRDWFLVLENLPIYMFLGPFAFIANFPI